MAVEFISLSKENFSDQLKKVIVDEFSQNAFDELPSQEHH
jgi:hypothetical protein